MASNDGDDDAVYDARVLAALVKWQQQHVLAVLQRADNSGSALRTQLVHFERWYRGGLDTYMTNATRLFRAQQQQPSSSTDSEKAATASTTYADWQPSVPRVIDATSSDAPLPVTHVDSPRYRELEALGLAHVRTSAFVVVAGGLGERLGFDDIKLKLPVETLTHTSYLAQYIQHLRALEALVATDADEDRIQIPLAIMTSDVTHAATREFLIQNHFFGMLETQITLIKQETVPCVTVYEQQLVLALTLDGSEQLVMKPHGHGDVHALLHRSGLATRWFTQLHKRYVHIFQDTNALIVHSWLPLLGAAVEHNWTFAFTAVPRKAKDASGAVVRFASTDSESALFNVEYHELDAFLKRAPLNALFPHGDVNDRTTGVSPFPGNINHVLVELASYVAVLDTTGGFVPETFNPKLLQNSNSLTAIQFATPARLECMLQDYPKLLVAASASSESSNSYNRLLQHGIGVVVFPSALVYSPCKNDSASASVKAAADVPPQSAGSAEHDLFAVHCLRLAAAGVRFDNSNLSEPLTNWLGVPLACSKPQIVLSPTFAPTLELLTKRLPTPLEITISNRSTLVVDGDVTIYKLRLDGAVRIVACPGARVVVLHLRVTNAGVCYKRQRMDEAVDPVVAMRGYELHVDAMRTFVFDTPGDFVIDEHDDEDVSN